MNNFQNKKEISKKLKKEQLMKVSQYQVLQYGKFALKIKNQSTR